MFFMENVLHWCKFTFFAKKTRRRRKSWIFLFIFSLLVSLTMYSVQLYLVKSKYYNPPHSHFTNNYFLSTEEVRKMSYIVRTPSCHILNMSAWDEAILPILVEEDKAPLNCRALLLRTWTYTQGTNLVINVSSMAESGFSMASISCCYFQITRVEQSMDNYDRNADFRIKYSSCIPLPKVVNPIQHPYIRVHCRGKYWPLSSDVFYRRFHALPILPDDQKTKTKISSWQTNPHKKKPPNILIVGIDSMSRLGFQRTMPRTREVLLKMGAKEMKGYTKVGENTLPNIMAALGGYSQNEYYEMCFFNNTTPQDACPYIWERFSAANYLTAFVEDAPLLAIFHYLKTGFVKAPTDIYFRPFMLGVHKNEPTPFFSIDCIGPETVDEVLLRYISEVLKASRNSDIPLFLFSWLTDLAHDNVMGAKYGDEFYADFFQNLDLSNTVLFFMGDHGYRFGRIRQTFPGWYEEKLPNMWIYLPPNIANNHKYWAQSIQTNSQRLTSTFDIYWTLSQILDEFTTAPELRLGKINLTGEPVPRRIGQSLFKEVPLLRKCAEAGIVDNFCACVVPHRLSSNDSYLVGAARAAVDYLNSLLPPACASLTLANVDAGAVMDVDPTEASITNATYIVAFITNPGQFVFEATVGYSSQDGAVGEGNYTITTDILRMSKINTDVSCIRDGFLERFCYCLSNGKLKKS